MVETEETEETERHKVGLEEDGHEGRNSFDFALKSNSTACKIVPLLLSREWHQCVELKNQLWIPTEN